MAAVELHQFRYSHYNEKVRWALAYKGIAHERIDYLPGPHAPQMLRLSGQRATPVLRIDGRVVAGSAAIVSELERRFPERPLYPADAGAREQALAIERRCDDEVSPATRRIVYDRMLPTPQYIASMFSGGRPAWQRALYSVAILGIKEGMRSASGVTPEAVAAGERTVAAFLDYLAEATSRTGYLVGDAFTIADLAVASSLTPVLDVRHIDVAKPLPMPARLAETVARYEAHPAARWVHRVYGRYRS